MWRNLKELFRYRALVLALVSRQLATRYRGSVLGFLWTLLNPLCLMLVYTLVFQYYLRSNEVEHYTIFLFCGLLPWVWLTSGLTEGTASIVSSGHLITKSMFPAHILPTVSVLSTMINFLLSLPLLFVFLVVAGVPLHATALLVPLVIILQFLLLQGLSLALGSLNVQFRDIQHVVANLLMLIFFLCPIVYPATVVPERFRFTLNFNPFALLTEFYHDLILNGVLPPLASVGYLVMAVVASLLIGHAIFNRYRETFAESL